MGGFACVFTTEFAGVLRAVHGQFMGSSSAVHW
jgi:hypothetical protein